MTDIPTPFNSSPDNQTPISQLETPFEITEPININTNNDLPKITYKTTSNWTACVMSTSFFICGLIPTSAMLIISIYNHKPEYMLISIFAILVLITGIFFGSYFSIYFLLTIDVNAGIVIVKSRKTCFCFNKKK